MKYFMWLIRCITSIDDPSYPRRYMSLLSFLFRTRFIPNDDELYLDDLNRVSDGIDLRSKYDRDWTSNNPCSILEMLVALSIKMESIMYNPEYGDRTSKWFWDMIENWLTLEAYSDENWVTRGASLTTKSTSEEALMLDIQRLYTHNYGINGEGSLFYVENCSCDMRYLPIWYQMQEFIKTIPE